MKKTMKVVVIIVIVILLMIGGIFFHCWMLQRDGFVGGERVEIDGVRYRYVSFELTKEGKTIGLLDDWKINEISEDPSHTFLVVRSFLDQYYIVREDYQIPTEGKVSCAYIGQYERTEEPELLDALTEILKNEYTDGTEYFISNERGANDTFRNISVGYEGCPVGTDHSIYYIGKVDCKWVVIFRDELGEWENDKLPAVYYELDDKYGEIFERSGYWK